MYGCLLFSSIDRVLDKILYKILLDCEELEYMIADMNEWFISFDVSHLFHIVLVLVLLYSFHNGDVIHIWNSSKAHIINQEKISCVLNFPHTKLLRLIVSPLFVFVFLHYLSYSPVRSTGNLEYPPCFCRAFGCEFGCALP